MKEVLKPGIQATWGQKCRVGFPCNAGKPRMQGITITLSFVWTALQHCHSRSVLSFFWGGGDLKQQITSIVYIINFHKTEKRNISCYTQGMPHFLNGCEFNDLWGMYYINFSLEWSELLDPSGPIIFLQELHGQNWRQGAPMGATFSITTTICLISHAHITGHSDKSAGHGRRQCARRHNGNTLFPLQLQSA